ncbi:F-box/kelch-repeat protein At1g15670-like [Zingiber officinale]|uniref:F-box/kelch-repeat protein At1g15670-like n=1 Tax=Zingiber officinale TaxID=94328 RepID=UPI001C4B5C4E|nr:F-box/kelch-repeat protein At1g15670-like [Zingiber officinale]
MSRPIPISPHHFDLYELLRYNREAPRSVRSVPFRRCLIPPAAIINVPICSVPTVPEAELIPGLPDCLALECLIRVPFHAILDARGVCKRWKHELDSPSFYRIRRAAGLAPRVVTLLFRGKLPHTVGKFHLALYEPDTGVFTMRQLASNRPNFKKGIRIHAMVVGRELVVIGGWDVLENRSTAEVNIYDLLSGAWRPGAPNPAPGRTCCVYGLKGGKVFVVGGRVKKLVYDVADDKWFDRDANGKKLRSALVYDVAADTWLEIPDLGQDKCQGTSINGSFCSKFWQTREEYNNAIQYCRELLLLDDKCYLRMTKDGKEIAICVRKGKVMMEEVRLSDDVLGTLQQRLGLRPKEVHLYLKSYILDRL